MGLMIDGKWDNDATNPSDARGYFIREASRFRHWITPDGKPEHPGEGGFEAEANRYHLFVSPSCPWAHRTIIMRKLKRLEGIVSISLADRPHQRFRLQLSQQQRVPRGLCPNATGL